MASNTSTLSAPRSSTAVARASHATKVYGAGDTAVLPNAPVLAYGRTWRRSGIVCRSRRTGLRCTNRTGHGFTLAREAWRIF